MKIDEITALIKKQIKEFSTEVKPDETGTVISVGDGIAMVYGITNAMFHELLLFSNGTYGLAFNLETDCIGVVLLGSDEGIKENSVVTRTKQIVFTKVGNEFLGRIVNGIGLPIDGLAKVKTKTTMPIERVAPGIMTRQSVFQPLQTGLLTIDALIPIGKGQRELIIGDRETGKTAIAIDSVLNQKNKDVICIYVAIGQKRANVNLIAEQLRKANAIDYSTIVSATASDAPSMQYLAPYTACTLAEHWMQQGKDVLIIYDDLSKHAVAYRTISLLLRRPPGREAYPGDVFYLHSQLLERSAKLSKEFGGGSMTALPIIETQAGDISAYIPTNVISITDGQIYLSTNLFNSGFRPAIDIGLSVSRVGASAQIKAVKKSGSKIKFELANYREVKELSQFGSQLDKGTLEILDKGEKINDLLIQSQYEPIPVTMQVIILLAIRDNIIQYIPRKHIFAWKAKLLATYPNQQAKCYKKLLEQSDYDEAFESELVNSIKQETIKIMDLLIDFSTDDNDALKVMKEAFA